MRVIKMLGAALIFCAAFVGVSVNAQTPVSCTWTVVSSYGPPNNSYRNIVRECRESNNALVATQSFVGYSSGAVQNCVLTPAANITYTGACMSPGFFRNAASSSSAQSSSAVPVCANAGKFLGQGCANGTVNIPVQTACGNYCSLRFETIGWTAKCPHPGQSPAGSPEVKVYCQ